ncbi:thioesterase [Nocardia neocaledoniensis NBRC 108232]|uniref:Thioesterase superfamily protein n=1 Tax=Nocardia neocaledoniensis TaxID=236511 RepID=A0A317N110_9NOCA|nr:acyl-CoA thioesterase domain-containing protein [Nocardia neocaledoniensis]PWV67574.1 thioesterase superfamily protein [Nocardia neocaledoniensis]GEM31272.1 thioesterase [Nocardia neocaledoniensis NBRC 108232]
MRQTAFFDTDLVTAGLLHPTPAAGSGWAGGQMRGMAISAALAREVERRVAEQGPTSLRPTRWTLDLFRAVAMRPCTVETEIVRAGRRLCLVDARLCQDGTPVAAARALYLAAGDARPGRCWSVDSAPIPPPPTWHRDPDTSRIYYSGDAGWDADPARHHNTSRNRVWHAAITVVDGEKATPFQFACAVADVTNVVTNLGSQGLEYINTDVTVAFSRLPIGDEMGVSASDRHERDGIAIGTAELYDRTGVFGTATVTALTATQPADLTAAHSR